jgi:hypothetical protein
MNEHLKRLSAETALNNMMSEPHFSICAIDAAAKVLGINAGGEAYDILRPLHCIKWDKIPPALRDAVPSLIEQCLGVKPAYVFQLADAPAIRHVVDITPKQAAPEQRHRLLRLLGR